MRCKRGLERFAQQGGIPPQRGDLHQVLPRWRETRVQFDRAPEVLRSPREVVGLFQRATVMEEAVGDPVLELGAVRRELQELIPGRTSGPVARATRVIRADQCVQVAAIDRAQPVAILPGDRANYLDLIRRYVRAPIMDGQNTECSQCKGRVMCDGTLEMV